MKRALEPGVDGDEEESSILGTEEDLDDVELEDEEEGEEEFDDDEEEEETDYEEDEDAEDDDGDYEELDDEEFEERYNELVTENEALRKLVRELKNRPNDPQTKALIVELLKSNH